MKIACVIVNYNDAKTTIALLKQICDYKSLNHIIIVDNCSTDNSYASLKQFETNNIIVLQAEKNKGYGAGNNFGIKYAKDILHYYCESGCEFHRSLCEKDSTDLFRR